MKDLSLVEKAATQQFLAQGMSVDDIAKELKKNRDTVDRYVSTELDQLNSTVAKVQLDKEEKPEVVTAEIGTPDVDESIWKEALRLLLNAGLNDESKCRHLLNQAVKKFERPVENAQELYGVALQCIDSRTLIHTQAAGGAKGVAVMTKAASEKGDDHLKKVPTGISRSARGNIYDIEKDEILGLEEEEKDE